MRKRTVRSAGLLAVILLSFGVVACEDDPILEPQERDPQGGSYGRIDKMRPDSSLHGWQSVMANPEENPRLF